MTELVQLASPRLCARINMVGAELWSLVDAEGRELLWPGDPAIWPDRAPLLFPVVGASPEARVRYRGREAAMPMHGFARKLPFAVHRLSDGAVLFTLVDSEATHAAYPFAFRLDVRFTVEDACLETVARVTNTGGAPLPASFGYHPGFRWPLAEDLPRMAHRVLFEKEEAATLRRVALPSRLLDREPHPSPVEGHILRPRDALFENGALIFDAPRSRAVWFGVEDRLGLEVAFPDMPHLGIWSRPGASLLAIEPWRGLPAEEGSDGEMASRPGVTMLAPGESFACTMRITVAARASFD